MGIVSRVSVFRSSDFDGREVGVCISSLLGSVSRLTLPPWSCSRRRGRRRTFLLRYVGLGFHVLFIVEYPTRIN